MKNLSDEKIGSFFINLTKTISFNRFLKATIVSIFGLYS